MHFPGKKTEKVYFIPAIPYCVYKNAVYVLIPEILIKVRRYMSISPIADVDSNNTVTMYGNIFFKRKKKISILPEQVKSLQKSASIPEKVLFNSFLFTEYTTTPVTTAKERKRVVRYFL